MAATSVAENGRPHGSLIEDAHAGLQRRLVQTRAVAELAIEAGVSAGARAPAA
jgi:hypothetical protein